MHLPGAGRGGGESIVQLQHSFLLSHLPKLDGRKKKTTQNAILQLRLSCGYGKEIHLCTLGRIDQSRNTKLGERHLSQSAEHELLSQKYSAI